MSAIGLQGFESVITTPNLEWSSGLSSSALSEDLELYDSQGTNTRDRSSTSSFSSSTADWSGSSGSTSFEDLDSPMSNGHSGCIQDPFIHNDGNSSHTTLSSLALDYSPNTPPNSDFFGYTAPVPLCHPLSVDVTHNIVDEDNSSDMTTDATTLCYTPSSNVPTLAGYAVTWANHPLVLFDTSPYYIRSLFADSKIIADMITDKYVFYVDFLTDTDRVPVVPCQIVGVNDRLGLDFCSKLDNRKFVLAVTAYDKSMLNTVHSSTVTSPATILLRDNLSRQEKTLSRELFLFPQEVVTDFFGKTKGTLSKWNKSAQQRARGSSLHNCKKCRSKPECGCQVWKSRRVKKVMNELVQALSSHIDKNSNDVENVLKATRTLHEAVSAPAGEQKQRIKKGYDGGSVEAREYFLEERARRWGLFLVMEAWVKSVEDQGKWRRVVEKFEELEGLLPVMNGDGL